MELFNLLLPLPVHNSVFVSSGKTASVSAVFLIILLSLFVSACSESTSQLPENSQQNATVKIQSASTINYDKTHSENHSIEKKPAEYRIFLTPSFQGINSQKSQSFNCEDKVFAVIEFNHYPAKLHQLRFSWKDPGGEERELNEFPFFVTGDQTFAWAALKLHRSVGAGMLQWINPAAGMEEFIGTWTIDVSAEGLFEKKVEFEVLC